MRRAFCTMARGSRCRARARGAHRTTAAMQYVRPSMRMLVRPSCIAARH